MSIFRKGRLFKVCNIINRRWLSTDFNELAKEPFDPERWSKALNPHEYGIQILHDPLWNKSLGFDLSERDRLGLRGLLPPTVRSLENQVERIMAQLRERPNPIQRNLFLRSLQDRNETLYFRCLVENIEELSPVVYTPTVGDVCSKFGSQFHRTRGMYFSNDDKGLFKSMVYNWPQDDVKIIVVTDGSRILGLGDLGAHGMGISIGKLALYCAAGGIAPHRVLPVTLDFGTNNEELMNDPDYIGVRHKRLQGREYLELVDEFIASVFDRWPNCVVQFEDFETTKAIPLLERYKHHFRVFNDDIQGTGAVTLAGMISAAKIAKIPFEKMRFMCVGAGSAGLGVCEQIVRGLMASGLTRKEAHDKFVVCTVEGALGAKSKAKKSTNHDNSITHTWINEEVADGSSLLETVNAFKPHVLLGLSACANAFSEDLIKAMASHTERPIIMPMSNPTSKVECTPEQAYKWTNGKAIVATGSPFTPVKMSSGETLIPSQCNNMFIFPGLGLAASLTSVDSISDQMLYACAVACANCVKEDEIKEGRTFPKIRRIREVSHAVGK